MLSRLLNSRQAPVVLTTSMLLLAGGALGYHQLHSAAPSAPTKPATIVAVLPSALKPIYSPAQTEQYLRELRKVRQMFTTLPDEEVMHGFDEQVWRKDLERLISSRTPIPKEAGLMARYVYRYSRMFALPTDVVLGIISVESRFNRLALSNKGAQGLMQVMPFWKEQLGSNDDDLYDIETNIRYGCAIMRIYLDRFNGNYTAALAGYNGSLGSEEYPNLVYAQMHRFHASDDDLLISRQ